MTFNKSRLSILALVISLLIFASACGGGSSSSSNATNVASSSPLSATCNNSTGNCATLTTDNGLGNGYTNGAFTTVKVCVPGSSSSCATISGVLVDTGSVGLRLLKSLVPSGLPRSTISGGALVECYPFVASYMWGPVATADVQIAGETASGTHIMLIDDSTPTAFTVPGDCSGYNGGASSLPANTVGELGANGILGIGSTQQDCGIFCEGSISSQTNGSGFVGLYYNCASSSSCTGTSAPLLTQVPNPVSQFATDNNGTAISLPSVSSAGAPTLAGALYFGIGTQFNNPMPTAATVLELDARNEQFITTVYKSTTNTHSYIDSGSNGYFFKDSTIPACTNTPTDQFLSDWFCPTATASLSATNSGIAGSSGSSTVSFSVANAITLFNNNTGLDNVFSDLGGPGATNTFDWGLPFFYGRVVYNVIEQKTVTNTGGTTFTGPFVAY